MNAGSSGRTEKIGRVLTKDDRIRYRKVERDAFVAANLRVFCLTTARMRREEQTERS